jgi:hypothetical protein
MAMNPSEIASALKQYLGDWISDWLKNHVMSSGGVPANVDPSDVWNAFVSVLSGKAADVTIEGLNAQIDGTLASELMQGAITTVSQWVPSDVAETMAALVLKAGNGAAGGVVGAGVWLALSASPAGPANEEQNLLQYVSNCNANGVDPLTGQAISSTNGGGTTGAQTGEIAVASGGNVDLFSLTWSPGTDGVDTIAPLPTTSSQAVLNSSLILLSSSASGSTYLGQTSGNLYNLKADGTGAVASMNNDGSWTLEGLASGSPSVNISDVQGSPSFDSTTGNLNVTTAEGAFAVTPAGTLVTITGAISASIGDSNVSIITPPSGSNSSPFAVISTADAGVPSSNVLNVLAYPQGPAALTAARSHKRRLGSLWMSHDRGSAGTDGRAALWGFIRRDGYPGGHRRGRWAVRGPSSGRTVGRFGGAERHSGLFVDLEAGLAVGSGRNRRLPVRNEPGSMSSHGIRTTHGRGHDVSLGFGGLGR